MSVICAYCGCSLEEDEVYSLGDVIMCEDCYDSNTRTCDCCGERIWNGDDEGDDDIILCRHCRDNHYTTCEDCGRLIHDDDAYYIDEDSDYPYCHSCYTNHKRKYIHSYSYKPEPIFHGDGNLYMGVELEIDGAGCDDDNAEKLCDIADKSQLYIKTDGSLDEGMELVTHPMTLEYHLKNMAIVPTKRLLADFMFMSTGKHLAVIVPNRMKLFPGFCSLSSVSGRKCLGFQEGQNIR